MSQARALLLHHFGYAEFRPAQIPIIRSVLEGRDTLAILPTGGGKSICFQVPALVVGGLTIVVSPLISLMQDQVEAATARGLPAAGLNSSLGKTEQARVRSGVADGSLRLLVRVPRAAGMQSGAGTRGRDRSLPLSHPIAVVRTRGGVPEN